MNVCVKKSLNWIYSIKRSCLFGRFRLNHLFIWIMIVFNVWNVMVTMSFKKWTKKDDRILKILHAFWRWMKGLWHDMRVSFGELALQMVRVLKLRNLKGKLELELCTCLLWIIFPDENGFWKKTSIIAHLCRKGGINMIRNIVSWHLYYYTCVM